MIIVSLEKFNQLISRPLYLERPDSSRASAILQSFFDLTEHRPDIFNPGLDLSHPFVSLFLPDCLDLLRAYSEERVLDIERLQPIVRDLRLHFVKLLTPTRNTNYSCYGVYRNVFNH